MKLSQKGAEFILAEEGLVLTAYRDPVGVLTIGAGFTERSKIFRSWFRAKHGRSMRLGDRITQADALQLLSKMVNEEYGPPCLEQLPIRKQHEFDGAVSVCYNLGPRALGWRWAKAWRSGNIKEACQILATNYNTAGGRKLPGLVKRRKKEARLIEFGVYHGPGEINTRKAQDIEDKKLLEKLGYKRPSWVATVREFQADNPPLKVDGIFGRASRATATRLLANKKGAQAVSGASVAAIAGSGAAYASDASSAILYGSLAVGVIVFVAGVWAWRNRGKIEMNLRKILGKG